MVSKKDPICGMEGHLLKHNHYFCSTNCVDKYEKQEGINQGFFKTPLFKIILYIVVTILLIGLLWLLQTTGYMILFMGIFFVLVSILKFLDWKGFTKAFAMYDIVAKRSKLYAYIYPLIELALGISYLFVWQIKITAIVTFVIMSVGSIGVAKNLMAKNPIKCACLGTKVKIPLTKFTLFEDITMAVMALMILLL